MDYFSSIQFDSIMVDLFIESIRFDNDLIIEPSNISKIVEKWSKMVEIFDNIR